MLIKERIVVFDYSISRSTLIENIIRCPLIIYSRSQALMCFTSIRRQEQRQLIFNLISNFSIDKIRLQFRYFNKFYATSLKIIKRHRRSRNLSCNFYYFYVFFTINCRIVPITKNFLIPIYFITNFITYSYIFIICIYSCHIKICLLIILPASFCGNIAEIRIPSYRLTFPNLSIVIVCMIISLTSII